MTDVAKKQKNREYYLKNRDRILTRAKARKSQKRGTHLEIVPTLKADSSDCSAETMRISETTEFSNPEAVAEIFQPASAPARFQIGEAMESDSSQDGLVSSEKATPAEISPASIFEEGSKLGTSEVPQMKKRIAGWLALFFRSIPLSFMIRLLLVVGLIILMTAMQVEFYREHDILPGYAVPLAFASELAFLSLVTLKFGRALEWLRIIIHLIFFGYFVSALSFHVYAKSRTKAASQSSVSISEATEIRDQLYQAERAFDVATKGRAWKNMEILGAEVSRLRKLSHELPTAPILGTSSDQSLWIEAILLILLRALLLAASALNTLRLRNQFCEMTHYIRYATPRM